MSHRSELLITARVLRELDGARRIALGPGMPEHLMPSLPPNVEVVRLQETTGPLEVDVAIIEPVEVSEKGDLVAEGIPNLDQVHAARWIAAGPMLRPDGGPVLVKQCRLPVAKANCVDVIINEFGVIKVGKVGFELTELAPGRSSDDIRLRVRVSLHVVDGLATFRL
jgi:acyl CoA:acetate/3-ketoacid CoA transferase beta subunit